MSMDQEEALTWAGGKVGSHGSDHLPWPSVIDGSLARLLAGRPATGNDMDDNSLDAKRAQLTQDHHDFLRGPRFPCCRSLSGTPNQRAKLLATRHLPDPT